MSRLASAWDTYEFGARNRTRGGARVSALAPAFQGRRPAAGRARGVPVHLPPLRDVPGVEVRIEIAGVPESATLSAGRVEASGLWTLARAECAGLRMLPAGGSSGQALSAPVSLDVTFVATDLATGRSGSMITTIDIPAAWAGRSGDEFAAAGSVRYSLADDAGGRFEIDPVSGLVAVADESLLDAAAERRHRIAVRMAFSDGQIVTRHYEIERLDGAGEFAVTELWDRNGGRRSAARGVRPGTVVGTVSVPVDVNAMDVLRFRLLDDADGRFAIDPWTGVVTVAGSSAFDGAFGACNTIVVEVTSADGWMSVQQFTVSGDGRDGSFVVSAESVDDTATDDSGDAWHPAGHYLPRPAA